LALAASNSLSKSAAVFCSSSLGSSLVGLSACGGVMVDAEFCFTGEVAKAWGATAVGACCRGLVATY